MSKTIEVMEGDTFFVARSCEAAIVRGDKWRWMGEPNWYSHSPTCKQRFIDLAQFRTIAEIAGYTVVTAPAKEEVVEVTHGAESVGRPGCLMMLGTREGVERWVADSTAYRLVPIRIGGAT